MASYGVIGASGFVGQHLCTELLRRGHQVRAIVRTAGSAPGGCEEIVVGDFTEVSDWALFLQGLDAIQCLAARVHVMNETAADPLVEFRKINVDVTHAIARGAIAADVPRLVYLSSIKVNGEATPPGHPFRADDRPNPLDPYGVSKLEAEQALKSLSSDLGIVAIRPPLVYGPGVGGNFLRLLKLATSGLPLPFGSIRNARAMIAVENLVDAIIHFSEADIQGMSVMLVSDGEPLSTSELLRLIADEGGSKSRLIPFPPAILRFGLRILGKQAEGERLLGSLEVEISSSPSGSSWQPPFSTEDTVRRTATWYREQATQ